MIGAAIPLWGEELRTDIPPEIGALVFYKKSWSLEGEELFEVIKTRTCTWDDFDRSIKNQSVDSFDETEF